MQTTIGGNRVGSGKKMRAWLDNYRRSTHDLSEKFRSSAASGVLYPCLVKPATRGDSFDIDIAADCRTIPTIGPLFGSYKLQIDVYQCPQRLYQGLLHNNPLAIGLNASKVKLPMLHTGGKYKKGERGVKFDESCLLTYLGMKGLGKSYEESDPDISEYTVYRDISATPALAYYDIYKCYYANKQEEKGYYITGTDQGITIGTKGMYWYYGTNNGAPTTAEAFDSEVEIATNPSNTISIRIPQYKLLNLVATHPNETLFYLSAYDNEDNIIGDVYAMTIYQLANLQWNPILAGMNDKDYTQAEFRIGTSLYVVAKMNAEEIYFYITSRDALISKINFEQIAIQETYNEITKLQIDEFPLQYIDDMRYDILSSNTLGQFFKVTSSSNKPYKDLCDKYTDEEGIERTKNQFPMNGLVLKTYQNDIYNNWLNTEWIEGENGISEITKVYVDENGGFSMDALSFAKKKYNMLNRIAIGGGTYEEWQDVVYEAVKMRQIESPIYLGGMSQEIVFDEIVQTAPSEAGGEKTELGTLGGRGRLIGNKKGGKIHVKCDEACYIIAILSLTPRVNYTQGNEFYMTEIESLDDFHKPAMDGIGFQDLLGERLAWWDATIEMHAGVITGLNRTKIGKLPAWIEYMTSYDKAYGDFAKEYGMNSGMTLNRNYEYDETTHGIKDATTYVDPQKYNYAFAYKNLDAQNFWIEVYFDIKARRLMSARLIPNV